ncbi:MAG TPA: ECF transporter S component [Firmicutes bacterium]|nr:ECF transporter S component [Bacillota bacterium]
MKNSKGIFSNTRNLVLISILIALGAVLMLIEIPYPIVPFLKFDLSELVILITVELFGLVPAILVALFKSLVHVMVNGVTTPYAIGTITAFIASSTIAAFYMLAKKYFPARKFSSIVIRFLIVITGFAAVLTICNYLFITPIYFGALWFTDIKDFTTLNSFMPGLSYDLGYGAAIAFVYIPFNALKGFLVLLVYEMIAPRVLHHAQDLL